MMYKYNIIPLIKIIEERRVQQHQATALFAPPRVTMLGAIILSVLGSESTVAGVADLTSLITALLAGLCVLGAEVADLLSVCPNLAIIEEGLADGKKPPFARRLAMTTACCEVGVPS